MCEPITKLAYYVDPAAGAVLVYNGGPTSLDPSVHHMTVARGTGARAPSEKLVLGRSVLDFVCTGSSPWSSVLPSGLVVLMEGSLEVFGIRIGAGSKSTPPACPRALAPHALELQQSDVCCTAVASWLPGSVFTALKKLAAKKAAARETQAATACWPASGGNAPPSPLIKETRSVVATGHADGTVKLWSSTAGGALDLLDVLAPPSIAGVAEDSMVQYVDLCSKTGQLCVGYSDGTVLLFMFQTAGRRITPKVVDCTIVAVAAAERPTSPRTLQDNSQTQHPQTPIAARPNSRANNDVATPKKISQVTAMGFTEEQALQALIVSGGDVNVATANLFSADIDADLDDAPTLDTAAAAAAAAEPRALRTSTTSSVASGRSLTLGGGDELVEESGDGEDSPQKLTSRPRGGAYEAGPGYQCELVCTCKASTSGTVQQLASLRYCSAWDALAFGTETGVCVVTDCTAAAPRAQAYSVSQLIGVKAAKFQTAINSINVNSVAPSTDCVTAVAFGPATIGKVPVRALWVGTSKGETYAVSLTADVANAAPCVVAPIPTTTGDAVTAINFLIHQHGAQWVPEPPTFAPMVAAAVVAASPPPRSPSAEQADEDIVSSLVLIYPLSLLYDDCPCSDVPSLQQLSFWSAYLVTLVLLQHSLTHQRLSISHTHTSGKH
jgi:hypothetical protein